MFEISASDIALLNDTDLRALVGLLCEAEMRQQELPISGLTYGGSQDAGDGGIDVRVALPQVSQLAGFILRPATGFQVKQTGMAATAIENEMRPKGTIRPAIQALAQESGAYVIVSGSSSVSDTSLIKRRGAMSRAVSTLPDSAALTLDFYDGGRLASWVRSYPALIPWVKSRIGKDMRGWQSYGAWAFSPDGEKGEYLIDAESRVFNPKGGKEDGVSALEGIQEIRALLHQPRNVLRLVGLSGVGKTRLVQALFDDRVGENPLNPALVYYADISDHPDPQPVGLAAALIVAKSRGIIVVDNCSSETHQRLSEICRAPGSLISVLTVEYDIREDGPEGTDFFELRPSSTALVEKLIKRRFPNIENVNAHAIAEFSGGNARIAVALATTIKQGETLVGLSDDALFRRLFHQAHAPDQALMAAGQALSLVYSFQGEDVSNDKSELGRLGALVGMSAPQMFAHSAELARRGLLQRRGEFRAVLPHAIANRLARDALQNISASTLNSTLVNGAPERVQRSFSRRIGYLHDRSEARAIAKTWLSPTGILANVLQLDQHRRAMFSNISAISPLETLEALERSVRQTPALSQVGNRTDFLRVIRSLAYEAELFERCVTLMLAFFEVEDASPRRNEAHDIFVSFFWLYLSGTHATIEQRLRVIETLIRSPNTRHKKLAMRGLEATLETTHFSSHYGFEFGARPRDYGFRPRGREDLDNWFGKSLGAAANYAITGNDEDSTWVRAALARKLRGLWTRAGVHDKLTSSCLAIAKRSFWPEGWVAVRQVLRYDYQKMNSGEAGKLCELEKELRPKTLVQRVQALMLSSQLDISSVDDFTPGEPIDITGELARIEATAKSLGEEVARDEAAFDELSASLVTGSGQLWALGRGLAYGSSEPEKIWRSLCARIRQTSPENQNAMVLRSFLYGLSEVNPDVVSGFLDEAVDDQTLSSWYPALQNSVQIDQKGIERLLRSLEGDKTPIAGFADLRVGRMVDSVSVRDVRTVLDKISKKPGGFDVALEILYMYVAGSAKDVKQLPEIVDIGCSLLSTIPFCQRNDSNDHRLKVITKYCLLEEKGAEAARNMCLRLRQAVEKGETHAYQNEALLEGLFSSQPLPALEGLFDGDEKDIEWGVTIINDARHFNRNPLDSVSDEVLLKWCSGRPELRFPAIASAITAWLPTEESGARAWTDIGLRLLRDAPDPIKVLERYIEAFMPMTWSGSLAAIVESNITLLDPLEKNSDDQIREYISNARKRLQDDVLEIRKTETERDRTRNERFET